MRKALENKRYGKKTGLMLSSGTAYSAVAGLFALLASALLSVGTSLCFCGAAGMGPANTLSVLLPVISAIVSCVVVWLFSRRRRGVLSALIIIIALAALGTLLGHRFVLGSGAVANGYISAFSKLTGRIFLPVEKSDGYAPAALAIISAAFAALISAAVNEFALMGLIPAAAIFIGVVTGTFGEKSFSSGTVGLLLIALGLLLLFGKRLSSKRQKGVYSAACIAVMLLAAALALFTGHGFNEAQRLRGDIAQSVHGVFCASPLPEGRVCSAGKGSNEKEQLKITLSVPQKLYLRGYIGGSFDGRSWRPIQSSELYNDWERIYLLHERSFYDHSMLFEALEALGETADLKVSVQNVGGCSRYMFIPYAADAAGYSDGGLLCDSTVKPSSYSYEFNCFSGSVPAWYSAQARLASADAEGEAGEYLSCESAWRETVYKLYLDIPDDTRKALAVLLPDAEGLTLPQARARILSLMSGEMTYTEERKALNGEFVSSLMKDGMRGDSTSYATLAVLLLRSCGVPARYVEGYYLPPELAKSMAPGDEITLYSSHAHAWAEYYLDGVGWVPFETVPGYIDPDEASAIDNGGSSEQNETPPKPPADEPEIHPRATVKLKPYMAIIAAGLLLAALIAVLIARRLRFLKMYNAMRSEKGSRGAALAAAYSAYICSLSGMECDPELEALNERALFGADELTDEETARAFALADACVSSAEKKWGALKTAYYKWIKCVCR